MRLPWHDHRARLSSSDVDKLVVAEGTVGADFANVAIGTYAVFMLLGYNVRAIIGY